MKLKDSVIISTYAEDHIAVAAGDAAKSFSGMIKMNETAAVICENLKNDTTIDAIVDILCEKYEVERNIALKNVENTIDVLRQTGLLEE